MLRGNHRIRQMIDTIESPHSIVLEYAEEDLRSLSIRRKLQRVETKTIARQLLEALAFAHAKNIVHTGRNASNHSDTFYRLPYHGQISSHRIFCFLDLHPTSSLLKHRSNWLILLMVCLILLIDVQPPDVYISKSLASVRLHDLPEVLSKSRILAWAALGSGC
jgi:hypothetical protein